MFDGCQTHAGCKISWHMLCRQQGQGRAAFEFWEGSCQPLVASTDAAGKAWRYVALAILMQHMLCSRQTDLVLPCYKAAASPIQLEPGCISTLHTYPPHIIMAKWLFNLRRRLAGAYDGNETPGDVVPVWVVEAVVHGRLPAKPDDKCAFVLQPAEVCSVDSLSVHCRTRYRVGHSTSWQPPVACRGPIPCSSLKVHWCPGVGAAGPGAGAAECAGHHALPEDCALHPRETVTLMHASSLTGMLQLHSIAAMRRCSHPS